jgi:hypothetical protein
MAMSNDQARTGSDHWGSSFVEDPADTAPVTLLKEQADALTRRTGGRVVGDVLAETDAERRTVWISLYARVPTLDDYRHKLISIAHPVIVDDPHLPFPLAVIDTQTDDGGEVHDMKGFTEWLSRVLSSDEVHNVISNLLRYSHDRVAS